jgi:putative SOS response-associated peptidase YedK
MCGRFAIDAPPDTMWERFKIDMHGEVIRNYNVAPTQIYPVIVSHENERQLFPKRWGLVPHWSKGIDNRYSMINTRSDALDKPAWRGPIRYRRCIIPASTYYEWQQTEHGKQPYAIRMQDCGLFGMAGVYDHWEKDGEYIDSFSILVTDANDTIRNIHDRMPVILDEADFDRWLDPSIQKIRDIEDLLVPCTDKAMHYYLVSKDVNSPGNNQPELLNPA